MRPINYDNASVDLYKDETNGIATIIINHPERKNAFTGTHIYIRDENSNLEKKEEINYASGIASKAVWGHAIKHISHNFRGKYGVQSILMTPAFFAAYR